MNPILKEAHELGTLGDAGYRMLLEIADAVRRRINVPPPEGLERWDEDAIAHFAMDWLWDPDQGPGRSAQMLATVDSDIALEAYLETCMENAFATQGRATDKGARRRALRWVVLSDQRIDVRKKPWRYSRPAHTTQHPFGGDPTQLTAAAKAVPVGPRPTWNSGTHRRPIGASNDVRSVVIAILDAAGCPCLEAPLVLDIVLERFEVDDTRPVHQQLADADQAISQDSQPTPHSPDVVRLAADLIWDRLRPKARVVLAAHVAGQSARAIEGSSGIPSSTVNRHTNLIDTYLGELGDTTYATAVVVELSTRSHQMAGTVGTGLASTSDVGTPT